MKMINPDREVRERKNWKRDLNFVVTLVLMLIVLLFAYLLINSTGFRYVLYVALAIFTSVKVTEWLTNVGEY